MPNKGSTHFLFTLAQAHRLDHASQVLAARGGPDASGVAILANQWARKIHRSFGPNQKTALNDFLYNRIAALEFADLLTPKVGQAPDQLPRMRVMESDPINLYLASRNQILLALVRFRSFAFDIDNQGKHMRLVGNFKGGGEQRLAQEPKAHKPELSSHAGVCLGPHTEPPYYCSTISSDGHSPAPSALILTARWNPQDEPTHVIPLHDVISKLGGFEALALSSKSFTFSRSDCFVRNESETPAPNSILQFDKHGGFTIRYSSYRFALANCASIEAKRALQTFQSLLETANVYKFVLTPATALLINNSRALHGREIVKDNGRLLVRLFGYAPYSRPLVIQHDPLIVRG